MGLQGGWTLLSKMVRSAGIMEEGFCWEVCVCLRGLLAREELESSRRS
jgi:hypothetical protein